MDPASGPGNLLEPTMANNAAIETGHDHTHTHTNTDTNIDTNTSTWTSINTGTARDPDSKHDEEDGSADSPELSTVRTQQSASHSTAGRRLSAMQAKLSTSVSAESHVYPSTARLIPILVAAYLAVFLMALDISILATAIPRITDDFHDLLDIAWYSNAYLLTNGAFQLFFGRLYTFYAPKWVYIGAVVLFEVGSAISGAAPNSVAFIFGRAIAGVGSCGIFNGTVVIITDTIPLHKRPAYQGVLGAVFGIALVAGPLLGGVFTSDVSWRWCFYINLPLGGATLLVMFLFLDANPPPNPTDAKGWRAKLNRLDPLGCILLLALLVCLILAVTWGGTRYPWGSARIVVLFVLVGVFLAAFVAVQIWMQENASAPPRLVKMPSVIGSVWYTFMLGGAMMVFIYYIAIWFQAIKGATPSSSGVRTLPTVISLALASLLSGVGVGKLGYSPPFMYFSSILMAVAGGLFTTWKVDTDHQLWISYQVLFGLGLGAGIQQPTIVMQVMLDRKDVAGGVSLIRLAQSVGGVISLAICDSIFTNSLTRNIEHQIPGSTGVAVANQVFVAGATSLRDNPKIPASLLPQIFLAYNGALVDTFRVGLVFACLIILGVPPIKWISTKRHKARDEQAAKAQKENERLAKANKNAETKPDSSTDPAHLEQGVLDDTSSHTKEEVDDGRAEKELEQIDIEKR